VDGNAKNISRFDNRLNNPIVYAIMRSNYIRVIDNMEKIICIRPIILFSLIFRRR
jgi:hypothetical protein